MSQENEFEELASSEPANSPSEIQETSTERGAEQPANAAVDEVELLPEYRMDDLPAPLREGFQKMGWSALMPVQARAIPYILAHRDVMIQSRTGSGKTAAYLVPIFQRINPAQNTTQALVLTPTRELAQQVVREAEALGSAMNVRTAAVYGGVGYRAQLDAFRQGAHLVVGTPGRILDHLLRRSMSLDHLKIMIFDEADRMLSMGFYPDMKRVQRYLPERPINTYMFSATFPPQVLGLTREFMTKPDFINLSSDHVHVTETEHIVYTVPPMDKERSLIRVIEVENPASAIIFCNTKERVHFVAVILQRMGIMPRKSARTCRRRCARRLWSVFAWAAAFYGGDRRGFAGNRPSAVVPCFPVRSPGRDGIVHPPRRAYRACGGQWGRHLDGQRVGTGRAGPHR